MKSITLLIILCSFSLFAQNTASSSDYDQVTLDGKTAYINVKTGAITTNRPNGMSSSTSSVQQTVQQTSYSTTIVGDNSGMHRVSKGQTLYSISRKYGVSIAELKCYCQ